MNAEKKLFTIGVGYVVIGLILSAIFLHLFLTLSSHHGLVGEVNDVVLQIAEEGSADLELTRDQIDQIYEPIRGKIGNGILISVLCLILFLTVFVCGIGILNKQRWARILFLIVSSLMCILIIVALILEFSIQNQINEPIDIAELEEQINELAYNDNLEALTDLYMSKVGQIIGKLFLRPILLKLIVWEFLLITFVGMAFFFMVRSEVAGLFPDERGFDFDSGDVDISPFGGKEPKPVFTPSPQPVPTPVEGKALAMLLEYEGDQAVNQYKLFGTTITLGREEDNDITLKNDTVGRYHAKIVFQNGNFILFDLGSTNPISVNGIQTKSKDLSDGDQIILGEVQLIFRSLT